MKKLFRALSTLAMLAVLVLAVLFVGMRLIGLTPYSVLSGSMEPTYRVGDLIYVKKIAPEDVEVGTVITYVANEQLVVATHRVAEISERRSESAPVLLEDGSPAMDAAGRAITMETPLETPVRSFLVRGDADPDAAGEVVHENNVLGTPVLRIAQLGLLVTMLKTDAGKVMAVCFGLVLVLLMFLPEMIAAIEKREQKKKESSPEADAKPQDEGKEKEDVLLCAEKQGEDVLVVPEHAEGEDRLIDDARA